MTGVMKRRSRRFEGRGFSNVSAENKVETRRVSVGPTQGNRITVEKGLNEGDLVIVEGAQKVRPGQAVSASPMPQPQGA